MPFNILVVDDSETLRVVIARNLEIAGVALDTLHLACDGQEALAIMKMHRIDLVFTDINMPVMGGVELIDQMMQDDLLAPVPVVVISTEGSTTRIESLKRKGVRAYIRKPFTPERLKGVIDELIGVADDDC